MSGFSLADWEASLGGAVSLDNIISAQAPKGEDNDFAELEPNKIYTVGIRSAKIISKNEVTKVQVNLEIKSGVLAGKLTTVWQELPFQAKDAKLNQETIVKLTGMRLKTLGTILGMADMQSVAAAAGELHDRIGQKLSEQEINGRTLFLVKVPQAGSDKYFYTNLTDYAPTKKFGMAE